VAVENHGSRRAQKDKNAQRVKICREEGKRSQKLSDLEFAGKGKIRENGKKKKEMIIRTLSWSKEFEKR